LTGLTCLACRGWPPVIRRARSAVLLEPPADALVHGLKYGGWSALAPVMASRMARLDLIPEGVRHVVFVPVPTTGRRRRQRGYNQAELLTRSLAGTTGQPFVDALERQGESRTQVSLRPAERLANVRRVFTLRGPEAHRVRGAHVVLVDDVLTTGATVSAASEVLERAGAAGVSVVAFARAVPRLPTDVVG
jgi:ComF family protein